MIKSSIFESMFSNKFPNLFANPLRIIFKKAGSIEDSPLEIEQIVSFCSSLKHSRDSVLFEI